MKKFINDPKNLTKELLEGFAIAHSDVVTLKSEKIVCRAQPKPASKVALVTLGGAGHEPALSGFVGEGDARLQRGRRHLRRARTAEGHRGAAHGEARRGHSVRRAEPRRRRA